VNPPRIGSHSALAQLAAALERRRSDALLRVRRTVESPQGARIRVDGRDVLAFASNDYLGLANDPALVTAA